MAISLTRMAMSCYAGGKLPWRQSLYHTQYRDWPASLSLVRVGSPAKNRFFHRNLANWILWEREFEKKENGGKMSSIGKNIRELCLFLQMLMLYVITSCMQFSCNKLCSTSSQTLACADDVLPVS